LCDIQADGRLLLIDFGLAKYYKDDLGNHDALTVTPNLFSGTPIYASMWTHDGMSSSRRSDLESLGYTMLQLCLESGLPWANLPDASRKKLKVIRAEIHDCKKKNSISSMCKSLPLPVAKAFCKYFHIVRSLGHAERPDCKPLC
jgi:casein kinase I family protein HRR25